MYSKSTIQGDWFIDGDGLNEGLNEEEMNEDGDSVQGNFLMFLFFYVGIVLYLKLEIKKKGWKSAFQKSGSAL